MLLGCLIRVSGVCCSSFMKKIIKNCLACECRIIMDLECGALRRFRKLVVSLVCYYFFTVDFSRLLSFGGLGGSYM